VGITVIPTKPNKTGGDNLYQGREVGKVDKKLRICQLAYSFYFIDEGAPRGLAESEVQTLLVSCNIQHDYVGIL